jgi:hypothetical protein
MLCDSYDVRRGRSARLTALVAHSLTAVAGSFITGSYDRTCKVWNTNTGEELLTLEVGAMRCATHMHDLQCNAWEGHIARRSGGAVDIGRSSPAGWHWPGRHGPGRRWPGRTALARTIQLPYHSRGCRVRRCNICTTDCRRHVWSTLAGTAAVLSSPVARQTRSCSH